MTSKYAKDVLMQGLARIIGGFLSFLSVFVLTYLFDEAQIGKYNLLLSTINVITSLFTLWLSQGILRYYKNKKDFGFVISSMLISSVGCIVTYFVFNLITVETVSIHAYIYILVLIYYNIFDAIFRTERKLISYVILELLLSFSRLFPMIIIALVTRNYNAIFISQYSLMFAYILIYLVKNRSLINVTFNIDKDLLTKYLKYGLPLLGLSISNWFLTSSDRYIIRYFENDFSVGIYSTNYALGNSIYMMIALIIINAFHPIIVKTWDNDKEEGIKLLNKVLDYYLMVVVPVVFYGCVKSSILLGMFKGDTYSKYNNIFIWTVLGIFIYGISIIYHKYYELTHNTIRILLYNLMAAVLNIALNFWLIPKYGFSVAAFTTFVSYVAYLLVVRVSTFKVFDVKFPIENIAKITAIILIFWILDYLISLPNSIVLFFIEGFIFVIYITVAYRFLNIIDIFRIFRRK